MDNQIDHNLSPEQVRQLPPLERIPYLKYIRLMYPRAQRILEEIRECYEERETANEPQCVLLVGPTGTGKTTLLEIFLEEHPRFMTEEGQVRIPVLLSTVMSPATVGNFASGLLESIGDPRYKKGLIGNRLFRVKEFLRDCQVKMLNMDEIHLFIDQNSRKVLAKVSDSLKGFLKEYNLACVLVGKDGEAEQVVNANDQLSRLFPDPITLDPFTWNEEQPQTIKEFTTLLLELEKVLPLNGDSKLASRDRAWRIYVATEGKMGWIMALVRKATREALKHGLESLDDALLEYACDKKLGCERRGIKNPFTGSPPEYRSPS